MTMRKLAVLTVVFVLAVTACVGRHANSGSSDTVGSVVPGDVLAGADIYQLSCAGCHARDLKGIDGIGTPLAPSEFVARSSENEVATLTLVGTSKGDPDNTTGIDMPARGGNPSLSDQAIQDVAAYLKSQN